MDILSTVLSTLGLVSMIISFLIKGKNMKKILFFVSLANILVAASYFVGGSGINGVASCCLGAIQAIINYFFESKNKPLPKWLVVIYGLSFVIVNLVVSGFNGLSVLAIFATLAFVMCIGQKNGAKYRFWTIINIVLWCLYDFISGSYSVLITHIPELVFVLVGVLIHDRKKKDKTEEAVK